MPLCIARGGAEYLRMMTRRRWIAGGLAAGAALAAAGLVYEFSPDGARADAGHRYTMLDARDRQIVGAIAPVMIGLPGLALAAERGVDVAIAGLPLATRAQIRQLFGLLRFPLSRMLLAGVWRPWHEAHPNEIAHFLTAWRYSPIPRLRAAYDALHQLVLAAWYGSDESWKAIGYPGPPHLA